MAFENPFDAPGEWLKGNLHTHTTLSDGDVSPQARASQYEARGYDFLALTDHDRLADVDSISTDRLILIPGIEIVCSNPTGGPAHHIVGLDLPADFQTPHTYDVQTVVSAINDAGGKAIISHPYWCGQSIKDLEVVAGTIGIEVFNTSCLRGIGRGTSSVHWDELLAQGKEVLGFAVDDAHRETRDAFQGWIVAKCEARSKDAVMDAIVRGRFYSSCGPTIEWLRVDGDRISVRTSPAAYISFICDDSRGGHVFNEDGWPVTEGEYALKGSEVFLRVECTDQAGRTAWTNPIVFR